MIYGDKQGSIIAGCVAFPKAKSYVWQLFYGANAPDADDQWIYADVTTKRKTVLKNFDSGTRVCVRYCAVTSKGMMAWSNPIDIVVG